MVFSGKGEGPVASKRVYSGIIENLLLMRSGEGGGKMRAQVPPLEQFDY